MHIMMIPTIALAMGDPAGIRPELTARLLALDDVAAKARLVVIGDSRVLDDGARIAAVRLDLKNVSPDADLQTARRRGFRRSRRLDPSSIKTGTATCTAEGGRLRWPIIVMP
jgi:4-hydroxythreonine-4-phosphate dehydrogenase